jgi:hypothetical protein
MEIPELEDFTLNLPDKMAVSVIMEKSAINHQWANYSFRAVGVVPAEEDKGHQVISIHQQEGTETFLITGLNLQLHVDECESYYHNLMSPNPGCFVVANETDDRDEMPLPYLVSLSFDEVHSYQEGGAQIYAVEISPQLYQWTEAYILTHYIATKKTKRKRDDWKQTSTDNAIKSNVQT